MVFHQDNSGQTDPCPRQTGSTRPGAPGAVRIQRRLLAQKPPRPQDKSTALTPPRHHPKQPPATTRPTTTAATTTTTAAPATIPIGTPVAGDPTVGGARPWVGRKPGRAGGDTLITEARKAPARRALGAGGPSPRAAMPAAGRSAPTADAVSTPTSAATPVLWAPAGDSEAPGAGGADTIVMTSAARVAPAREPSHRGQRPDRAGRLRPGELRALLARTLTARPRDGFTVTELSNTLRRSPGALANAAERLCEQGLVVRTRQRPKTYQSAPGKPST